MRFGISTIVLLAGAILTDCDQSRDSKNGVSESGISPNPNHTWFLGAICGYQETSANLCTPQDCSLRSGGPGGLAEVEPSAHIEDDGQGKVTLVEPEGDA